MKRIFLILILSFWCFPAILNAECVIQPYKVNGTVIDETTKKAVNVASVNVFFDDRRPREGFEVYKVTNGEFSTVLFFDTFKGYSFFNRHNCTSTPSRITVFVTSPGYRIKRISFDSKSLAGIRNPIHLPPIALIPTR